MPESMHPTLLERTVKVHGTGDWTWAFELIVDRNDVTLIETAFQLTNWGTPIDLTLTDQNGDPVVRTFQPAPMKFRELSYDAEGSVGSVEVSITDPFRRAIRYTEFGSGYRGKELTVIGYNVQSPGLGPCKYTRATIRNVVVQQVRGRNAAIMFHAEAANLNDGELPRKTIQAWRCDHIFAGKRCGFRVTDATPSGLRVCRHDWQHCLEHGDQEVAEGRVRLHPNRFGGEPGALVARGVSR